MSSTIGRPGGLRLALVNWQYGGLNLDNPSDDAGWQATVDVLAEQQPDVVLCQEIDAGGNPNRVWRHLWRTANAVGLSPILGPAGARRAATGLHTALLVRVSTGLRVVDQWPPPGVAAPAACWCTAELAIPGLDWSLRVSSMHLCARSPVEQLRAAQVITSYIADDEDQLHIVAGDTNGYGRGGPVPAPAEVAALRRRERLVRCLPGTGEPNYDVDDTFTAAGLVDVAAVLPADSREPAELSGTWHGPGAAWFERIDRCYASPPLAEAATAYRQVKTGSDHDAVFVDFDLGDVSDPERR